MERIFTTSIDLILPFFTSTFLKTLEQIQQEQSPPYSRGVYYLYILQRLKDTSFIANQSQLIFDPIFAALFKEDVFYSNPDMTEFSMRQLDETYQLYSEGIAKKY